MLRTQAVKLVRASNFQATRQFSAITCRFAEGDTGGTRSGGTASNDAFKNRENANESMYIREKEMESLRRLKEKLDEQQKHLDNLKGHISDLEKSNKK